MRIVLLCYCNLINYYYQPFFINDVLLDNCLKLTLNCNTHTVAVQSLYLFMIKMNCKEGAVGEGGNDDP